MLFFRPWGALGRSLGVPRAPLGRPWGVVGRPWAVPVPSVSALERPWAPLDAPGRSKEPRGVLDLAWHGNGKSIALKELVLRASGSARNRFRRQANGFTGKRRLSSSVVVCRRLLLFVVVSRRLPRNFPKIFQERVLKWYAVVCRRLSSSVVVCCGRAPKCSKEKKKTVPKCRTINLKWCRNGPN